MVDNVFWTASSFLLIHNRLRGFLMFSRGTERVHWKKWVNMFVEAGS